MMRSPPDFITPEKSPMDPPKKKPKKMLKEKNFLNAYEGQSPPFKSHEITIQIPSNPIKSPFKSHEITIQIPSNPIKSPFKSHQIP